MTFAILTRQLPCEPSECTRASLRPSAPWAQTRTRFSRRADVRQAVADVARAWRTVSHYRVQTAGGFQAFDQGVNTDARAAANIECSTDARRHGRLDIGLHDIADVHEVTGLLAISKDGDRLAAQHLKHEDRNDIAVSVKPLTRTINIEIPETDHLHAIQLCVRQSLFLGTELAGPIGRVGFYGMIFPNGQRLQFAENSGRRRSYYFSDSLLARRLEQPKRTQHIDLGIQ